MPPPPSFRGSTAPSFEALLDRPDLAWMGQNTTHLPPLPEVLQAIRDSVDRREFQLYAPAAGFERLRRQIVDDLGLDDHDCWVTNGAVDALHHVVRTLAGTISGVIASDPGWPWPGRFAAQSGVPVTVLPIYHHPRRLLLAEQLADVIQESSLLYLIDPLNPLGSSYRRSELEAIVDLARAHRAFVIQDATYRHFAEDHTLAATLYPERTITTYSFSKWLGLAGFRVGAVVATPDLLGELMAVPGNPLGVNIVGQRAAMAGLELRTRWLPELTRLTRSNIEAIEQVVGDTAGAEILVPRAQGNFTSVDISRTALDVESLCQALLDRDVFIRPGTYQSPEFGERFVKVSASVPAAWVERFVSAWTEIMADRAGSS